MKTLTIDEVRSKLYYKDNRYEGWKVTHNRKSVIEDGEFAMFYVNLPPKVFGGGKHSTYIITVTIMSDDGVNRYTDNESIKLLITKQDYEFITNVLKVKQDDIIVAKGNTYKNSKGFIIHGRKWIKLKSKEDKQKEVMDEIELE